MFNDPLTPEDEYWIGYFRADGSIYRDTASKRKIGRFTQTRFHPVNELAAYIGKPRRVVSRATLTNKGFCIAHTLSSSKLAYALDDLGTKTNLRSDLYNSRHFWRGMIDGDGCVMFYKIRSKTVGAWSPGIVLLATLDDIVAYQKFISGPLDGFEVYLQPTPSAGMYQASLCGNRAKLVTHLLYDNAYTANLKKYEKVKAILDKPWSTRHNSWRPHLPC